MVWGHYCFLGWDDSPSSFPRHRFGFPHPPGLCRRLPRTAWEEIVFLPVIPGKREITAWPWGHTRAPHFASRPPQFPAHSTAFELLPV